MSGNKLSRQDGLSLDDAKEVIRSWEWYFLVKNTMHKFYEHRRHELFFSCLSSRLSKKLAYMQNSIRKLEKYFEK